LMDTFEISYFPFNL